MRDSTSGNDDRGNIERLGESAGAMAGRAADFGMEVTGALFRSAAEMLGGWWSSDAPRQAAGAWSDQAERSCRSHFQSNGARSGSSDGGGSSSSGMHASGSVGGVSGSMSASGSTGGAGATGAVTPKSQHAAMQSAGELATDTGAAGSRSGASGVAFDASAKVGDTKMSGSAHAGGSSIEGAMSMDRASDGFEHARPGYQLGYVARRNPAYQGRSFGEIEPELQRVWESRAKTEGSGSASGSSWPEVRGFVDFAYQQGE